MKWILALMAMGLVATLSCSDDDGTKPPIDGTPPAAVNDLRVAAVTESTATLVWTAPGDDGTTGTAQAYQIRRSLATITESNWGAATQVPSPPTPQAAGSPETLTVPGLSPATPYFFALKTADDAGNESALSNVAHDTTAADVPPEPVLTIFPARLDFGADRTALTLSFMNQGGGVVAWTIEGTESWLDASPAAGTTTIETDEVTVTVDRSGLELGEYTGSLTVRPDMGDAQVIEVELSVAAVATGFVLLPAATFPMGSLPGEPGRLSCETRHEVTLTRGFYLSTHEVTQAEWEAIMGWNHSSFRGPTRPVETVTWYDCIDYCNQRSAREGYQPAYDMEVFERDGDHITSAMVVWNVEADGYRLPTEAEWEYACRAGSEGEVSAGGLTHPLCEPLDATLDGVGWYCGNARGATRSCGAKQANAWGLFDMHGNVSEWCADRCEFPIPDYPAQPVIDPVGPAFGNRRILRGGNWESYAQDCRSALRLSLYRYDRSDLLGLRVARTAR